jgi:hypothetical protein
VKQTADNTAGNLALAKMGGVWVSSNIHEIGFAALIKTKRMNSDSSEDLCNEAIGSVKKNSGENPLDLSFEAVLDEKVQTTVTEQLAEVAKSSEGNSDTSTPLEDTHFYDLFLAKTQSLCNDSPRAPDELMEAMDLNKTQLNIWLKRAVDDKKLKKLSKPVRYQWVANQQGALLFLE